MSRAKNYYNQPILHEAIQEIKVAFFMDHGVYLVQRQHNQQPHTAEIKIKADKRKKSTQCNLNIPLNNCLLYTADAR